MSIMIKGMEMPGRGCHHTICIYDNGTVEVGQPRPYMAIKIQPHGRLIDADNLLKTMISERNRIAKDYGSNDEYVRCFDKYAIDMVNCAPTIIETEEEI